MVLADREFFEKAINYDYPGFEEKRVAAEVCWVPLAELDAYPLSSPGRKLARFVLKSRC